MTATLEWRSDTLILLDQTRLPQEVAHLTCRRVETLAAAIEKLCVRGAPAIGVAAAYGVVLGAQEGLDKGPQACRRHILASIERLAATRPTAVNLFWALDRMRQVLDAHPELDEHSLREALLDEADRICAEDRALCRRIGRHGAALLQDGYTVLTHCNAGSLATAGCGTALGVIYTACEENKKLRVFADETRPLLQGSRLTAWELMQKGVDVTVICDHTAAALMRREKVDCILVGADRIAANGDVVNKIGTYGLAVLARQHGVPFYVAAPTSTLDLSLASGAQIPIEERRPDEVSHGFGTATAPPGVKVYNPAFDLTPHELVGAIISEKGVARAPLEPRLRRWVAGGDDG